jgi:hypothetical protein
VRYFAARALADAGDDAGDAVPALAESLNQPESQRARYHMIKALRHAREKAQPAISALKQAAQDPDPRVREAAEMTLKRLEKSTR